MFFFFSSFVQAGPFNNCSYFRFCSEAISRDPSNWSIKPTPIFQSSTELTYSLIQNSTSTNLSFTISFHSKGFKFHLNLPNNLSSYRYNVFADTDVFANQPEYLTYSISSESTFDHITPSSGAFSVNIFFNPFTIDLLDSNSNKYLTLNANQFLHIDHGEEVEPSSVIIHDINYTDMIPNGKTAVSFDFQFPGSDVYLSGISEKYIQFNLDDTSSSDPMRHFAHDSHSNYGYTPIIYSHYSNSPHTSAVFFANPSDQFISISTQYNSRDVRFIAEGGNLDFLIFFSETGIIPLITAITDLTGRPSLPPAFAFGYHQSKWGYETQEIVNRVLDDFNASETPLDVLWLDLDHLKDNAPMHFDTIKYPHPEELIKRLSNEKRFLVRLNDPHLPVSPSIAHPEYQAAHNLGYLVPLLNGSEMVVPCWPGDSAYPDFFRQEVKEWWSSLYQPENTDFFGKNVFFWNDMNEPAVFNTPEGTFFKDSIHSSTYEHREVHSLYGLKMVSATYAGLRKRDSEQRPFILSRSFFSGTQKYAWIWTGDNAADWEDFRISVHQIQTLSICGIPFAGADLGGFIFNPSEDLITRWYQAGVWIYPFFRSHCNFTSQFREPFVWGLPTSDRLKAAIKERYTLLPVWMKAAKETSENGVGPVLPLFAEFPGQNLDMAVENTILAHSILVAPVLNKDATSVKIYKPPGIWYNRNTGEKLENTCDEIVTMDSIPVFFKGGEIITLFNESAMQTTDQLKKGLVLYICLDENQTAKGNIYLDDGMSFQLDQNKILEANVSFSLKSGKLVVETTKKNTDSFFYDTVITKLIFFGLQKPIKLKIKGAAYQNCFNYSVVENVSLSLRESFSIKLNDGGNSKLALILGITIPVFVILVGVVIFIILRKRKLNHQHDIDTPLNDHVDPEEIYT